LSDLFEAKIDLFEAECKENPVCQKIISPVKEYISGSAPGIKDYLTEKGLEKLELAIIRIEDFKSPQDYFERTFSSKRRNEIRRTSKEGVYSRRLTGNEFNNHKDEIYQIHVSKSVRQGEMKSEFSEFPIDEPILVCNYHNYLYYGSYNTEGLLVGYIKMAICGGFADCSRLFGHCVFMNKFDFMRNLWVFMIEDIMINFKQIGYVCYDVMDTGGEGLINWKKSVGLKPVGFVLS